MCVFEKFPSKNINKEKINRRNIEEVNENEGKCSQKAKRTILKKASFFIDTAKNTKGTEEEESEKKHRTKKDISIAGNLSAHHLIFVQLIPREEMPFVNFILRGNANKSNGKEKKGDLMMRFGISEAGATIFLGENEIRLNRRLNKTAPSQLLEFIIAFNNCSYGIKLNGKFLLSSNISDGEEEFFPQKWWEQLRFDQMTSFEVRK
ncbi:hypothetical protein niasHT_006614 [Heterodera trifolii]|uniref:FHA domain-containing protein n=1 Tax=Heterodera trifolii TaxID=157864 RepID=A0ABD2M9Y5_9BILA